MRETRVRSLGWEDSLEKEMASHSSTIAWKIPWTEKPGRHSSWGRKESDTTERIHFHFPVNTQDWSPSEWTGWISLQSKGLFKSLLQHHSSKASILWRSAFFTVPLSHPYMTTGKTITLGLPNSPDVLDTVLVSQQGLWFSVIYSYLVMSLVLKSTKCAIFLLSKIYKATYAF